MIQKPVAGSSDSCRYAERKGSIRYDNKNKGRTDRSRSAIKAATSIIGIAVNALLAAVKVVIGQVTGSLAVSLNSVNNLTDAGSSVITLISTKLAERQPDKQHPHGFGRTEYLSTLVIAMIILYAGISSLSESVQKLLRGGVPSYSSLSLWILLLAVVSKIGRDCTPFPRGKGWFRISGGFGKGWPQ
ncbi:cation diffusion facilitator family transporter [Faecalibaculum rodentium]|uniref:cation diffusion facilitator family transporter n=1 Tax=Faecalibaculum rodentium TaxID=1702221 RepID=UPI002573CF0A|nr:cation diffusion facilitator family transporter [Faecalibaculum rodentium]